MANYYKKEKEQKTESVDMNTSISEYITRYAPDILSQSEIMQGVDAISFFIGIFKPSEAYDNKRFVKNSMDWPYANKIIYFARKFLTLSDREQRYIVKASKARIFWRGDDILNFRKIVEETISFRQLSDDEKKQYRKKILEIAKSFTSRYAHVQP